MDAPISLHFARSLDGAPSDEDLSLELNDAIAAVLAMCGGGWGWGGAWEAGGLPTAHWGHAHLVCAAQHTCARSLDDLRSQKPLSWV